MRRAFARAVAKVAPQYLIFLGDLLDEGIGASPAEFEATLQRFHSLFPRDNRTTNVSSSCALLNAASLLKIMFIVGDNDVGGEYEPVYPHLQERFRARFANDFSAAPADNPLDFSSVSRPLTSASFIRRSDRHFRRVASQKRRCGRRPSNPRQPLSGHKIASTGQQRARKLRRARLQPTLCRRSASAPIAPTS